MSLQKALLATEQHVKELQQLDSRSSEDSTCTAQSDSSSASGEDDTDKTNSGPEESNNNNEEHDKLRLQVEELQTELKTVIIQRSKLVANLRKRKNLWKAAEVDKTELEKKLEQAGLEQSALQNQVSSVRLGLQKVSAVRDDLKNKLRIKQELLKEARANCSAAERRCRQLQQEREMEGQLLALYREVANHYGYSRWGKRIRMLESELAASMLESSEK